MYQNIYTPKMHYCTYTYVYIIALSMCTMIAIHISHTLKRYMHIILMHIKGTISLQIQINSIPTQNNVNKNLLLSKV